MTTTLIGHPEPDPHLNDPAAERRLLGAVLRYPSIGDHALVTATAMAFTNDRHRAIFQAAAAVRGRGQPCDPAHVEAELSHHSSARADSVTIDDLHQLAAHAPPEPVAIYYLAIVRDLAALRPKPSPADPDTYRAQGNAPEGIPPMPMHGFLTDDD
ncbi:DnaB-like helicase N-terminal domain-containing protein [Streptomyces phytophilus]|uniref:DnaB-like helicase N-terminal domain-containing protein n=1 Tax=Streptomyces phytophilus TaxID=722715 RepID=UPI0015F08CAC|nr:DnaB-like helicase N-terminal domain-containing protein [Streptomyces phytophilus]